jgi:hypothetical protein
MQTHPRIALLGIMLVILAIPSVLAQQPAPVQAAAPLTQPLWPTGRMPGHGLKEEAVEHALPSRGDNVLRITDINEPTIAVFKPPGATKPTPAVIICPGGAYGILCIDKEGTEIAAWLNTIGITGVVLNYRVPNNQDGAFQDIQRAIRLVRESAAKWNIAPARVGVMGFSAGGHLCARLSTNSGKSTYPAIDGTDEQVNKIKAWKPLLQPYGIWFLEKGGSGVDIRDLKPLGIPLIALVTDSQRYFDYQHAASDTFDKVNVRELALGAAAMAALVELIDTEF